ncbi:MAG: ParB/RepB/Spo0J family partition protein [Pirellulaceae bacterium]|jgi:ParB-like chromosome segregation protein Spo0J|nr:ParB/RepB/Spo0J family partition protein [Pirellulaceae bacterium]|tara:strand:- start:136 stop:1065 length:930 start_codon:yes stop_codon:yes gene_type:complete
MTDRTLTWPQDEVRPLPLEWIDERLHRYRLAQPKVEKRMAESLERYGQVSPVVICLQEEEYVLIDGFKRLTAARSLKGMTSLQSRRMDVDEQGAKAAIYNLNRIGQRPLELEEAWIVHALVREDGLSQVEAAQLLGRHKSWVNRRLAMLERLGDAAREELRLGLLTPAVARQLTRLPRGNQSGALQTAREASLTSRELSGVVDLLLASSTQEQTSFVLSDPRQALRQADDRFVHHWDPRLSVAGNRVAKRLTLLLDCLARMQTWLRYQGRGELQACDREPLETGFRRLVQESRLTAEASEDFVKELHLP